MRNKKWIKTTQIIITKQGREPTTLLKRKKNSQAAIRIPGVKNNMKNRNRMPKSMMIYIIKTRRMTEMNLNSLRLIQAVRLDQDKDQQEMLSSEAEPTGKF